MGKAPTGNPGSLEPRSRPSEDRVVERLGKLPSPSRTETTRQRREIVDQSKRDGDRRVESAAKQLLAIREPLVRDAVKEIIRSGSLRSNLLRGLISVSKHIQGPEKAIVGVLEKGNIPLAMDRIELALRIDRNERIESETKRRVAKAISNPGKQEPVFSLDSYEQLSTKLYELLRDNFLYGAHSQDAFKRARLLIAELKKIEGEAEITNREHQLEFIGSTFGEQKDNPNPKDKENVEPVAAPSPRKEESFADRRKKSERYYP